MTLRVVPSHPPPMRPWQRSSLPAEHALTALSMGYGHREIGTGLLAWKTQLCTAGLVRVGRSCEFRSYAREAPRKDRSSPQLQSRRSKTCRSGSRDIHPRICRCMASSCWRATCPQLTCRLEISAKGHVRLFYFGQTRVRQRLRVAVVHVLDVVVVCRASQYDVVA